MENAYLSYGFISLVATLRSELHRAVSTTSEGPRIYIPPSAPRIHIVSGLQGSKEPFLLDRLREILYLFDPLAVKVTEMLYSKNLRICFDGGIGFWSGGRLRVHVTVHSLRLRPGHCTGFPFLAILSF